MDHKTRKQIADTISLNIDDHCESQQPYKGRRLGPSSIAKSCSRQIWYKFRWFRQEKIEARILRLFARGHREEPVLVEYLRGVGCQIWDVDPATGKQWAHTDLNGHMRMKLDGLGYLPPQFNYTKPIIYEFKTSKGGADFNAYAKHTYQGHPKHGDKYFGQSCLYGKAFDCDLSLVVVVNKDNDELYVELVQLDTAVADMLLRKGEDIALARTPPPVSYTHLTLPTKA